MTSYNQDIIIRKLNLVYNILMFNHFEESKAKEVVRRLDVKGARHGHSSIYKLNSRLGYVNGLSHREVLNLLKALHDVMPEYDYSYYYSPQKGSNAFSVFPAGMIHNDVI